MGAAIQACMQGLPEAQSCCSSVEASRVAEVVLRFRLVHVRQGGLVMLVLVTVVLTSLVFVCTGPVHCNS